MIEKMQEVLAKLVVPTRRAYGHSGTHSYVYVKVMDGAITGNVQFPISDLNEALDLSIPQDETGAASALATERATIERYINDHLTLGDAWSVRFDGIRVLERSRGSYAIFDYTVVGLPGPPPTEFSVSFNGIIESKPEHNALVIVKTAAGWGKLRDETDQQISYGAANTTQVVQVAAPSVTNDLKGAVRCVSKYLRTLARRIVKRLRRG